MNSNRIWTLSCVLVIGAIVAGGYFLGISPLLSAAAAADVDREGVEQQNLAYQSELVTLEADFADIDARRAALAAARAVIPNAAQDAQFVGELHELQGRTGATILSFSVSDPKAYAPVVSEVPAEVPTEGTEEATADGTATDEASADGTAAVTADTTPVAVSTPIVPGAELMTAESFTAIPYTVSVAGSLEQVQAYAAQMQGVSRLFTVTKLALEFDETTGLFTQAVDGYVWVYQADATGTAQTEPALAANAVAN